MDSAHVVEEVPSARESKTRNRAVAALEEAEVRVVAVAMEPVGLAFVAEEACVGRELQLSVHTRGDLAAVGLQVRV